MNEDTRVAVCCYAGDRQQVVNALDIYLHHECPVVVLSPEDSKVEIDHPCVENCSAGEREYIGYKAIARMREHLEIMLTFPERFFLIHDADSFCLTPKIPDYIYAEPDLIWTNLKIDDIPQQQACYPEGFPHIAFHPPWFMSRTTIEGLLAVADDVTPNPEMLFIDYWLIQLALKAGLKWRGFPEAISFPTFDPFFAGAAWDAARYRGTTFVHAVKTRETLMSLMIAHDLYIKDHSNE